MKKLKIYNLLLTGALTFAIASCDNEPDPDSVVTSFEKYPVATNFTAVTTDEGDEDVITFKVNLDAQKQLNDVVLHVAVAPTSTAEEGVDFEIAEHDIAVPAYAGQDGIDIEVQILQDGVPDEANETIYLTFSSEAPSGITATEVLIATIVDSDVASPLTIAAGWNTEFTSDGDTYDWADFSDLDFYVYNEDGDEVTGFAAATGNHPEVMELGGDLPDGRYELWVNFWNRAALEDEPACVDETGATYECLNFTFPIDLEFTRNVGGQEQTIEFSYPNYSNSFSDVFYQVDAVNTNPYVEFHLADIVVANGKFEIIDKDGDGAGSLRMRSKRPKQNKPSVTFPNL
jgi:hypothetical protein